MEGHWGKKSNFNPYTPWFETLKSEYCKNAKQKQYRITSETIDKALKKLQNGKAPGTDLIVGFWYENLMFYKADLVHIFQDTLKGHKELPSSWLIRARTQLLPKNENTHIAKNYHPITCQNLLFKLYASSINTFVKQHCEINNFVNTEQGGKQGVWGCLEQLLINKTE